MAEAPTKENLLAAMRAYLGDDERRIRHAERVFAYACEIQENEGGDPDVVICSAALHDIGIHEAERKYGSSAGNYQELEGPAVAAEILKNFDLTQDQIDHICKIIANHHSARDIDTVEFRAVWDADWLVNIPDEFDMKDTEKIERLFRKNLKTKTGSALAEKLVADAKL
jgi:hypothetical protein